MRYLDGILLNTEDAESALFQAAVDCQDQSWYHRQEHEQQQPYAEFHTRFLIIERVIDWLIGICF